MGTKLHPHQPKIHADINCKLSGNPSSMTLFAFRTHAHKHGTVITGYKVDENGKHISGGRNYGFCNRQCVLKDISVEKSTSPASIYELVSSKVIKEK